MGAEASGVYLNIASPDTINPRLLLQFSSSDLLRMRHRSLTKVNFRAISSTKRIEVNNENMKEEDK